jgi:hypothetical protein
MTNSARYPSYVDCVADALRASPHPLTMEELLAQIGERRPLGSGARSAVYRAINKLFQAVQVGPGVFGWLSTLLVGNIFRHQLSTEEIRRGFMLLDELEHIVFFPDFFQGYRPDDRRVSIELFGGPVIVAEAAIERKTWSLRLGSEFIRWVDMLGGQNADDLIIKVLDAAEGRYSVRLQPREIRDEKAIRARNVQLALLAEELVTEDRRTRPAVPAWELVAKLIGRNFFQGLLPVDDLHYVLHDLSALRLTEGLGYQLDMSRSTVPHARRYESTSLSDALDRDESAHMNHDYQDNRPGANDEDDESHENEFYVDGYGDLAGMDLDDDCEVYAQYVEAFNEYKRHGEQPLPHEDFHLLEAELEMLVRLEQEFGRLLADQERRKLELADQLFIDPNSLLDMDWDMNDGEDYEDPPFWQN